MARAFPLAGLLRLRQIEKEHAASDLAAANALRRTAQDRQASAIAALHAVPVEATDSSTLFALAAARASTRSMLTDLSALTEQAEAQAATAQAAFTEAKKRAVGLEKLENRHRAEVVAGELGAEQAAIDEIATGAWLRERVAGEGRGEA
ncbi:flagellar FliJ family protein [uncultured Leifsonia sp.]|uniref:flagellar FliJ family protein n=1 Tax=uncultured Leifsonia sp. TaxID=340359 RepID=UPI0028D6E3DC|nr:flagellar FliJ family protein [uncultured Leifsonia sp.]